MKHPPTDQSTKHPAAWSITKPKKTTYTQLVNPTEQPSHASTQLVLSPNEPTQKIPWRTIRISLIDPTNHRNFYSPIQPIFLVQSEKSNFHDVISSSDIESILLFLERSQLNFLPEPEYVASVHLFHRIRGRLTNAGAARRDNNRGIKAGVGRDRDRWQGREERERNVDDDK